MRQAGQQVSRVIDGDRADDQTVGRRLARLITVGSHGRQLYVR